MVVAELWVEQLQRLLLARERECSAGLKLALKGRVKSLDYNGKVIATVEGIYHKVQTVNLSFLEDNVELECTCTRDRCDHAFAAVFALASEAIRKSTEYRAIFAPLLSRRLGSTRGIAPVESVGEELIAFLGGAARPPEKWWETFQETTNRKKRTELIYDQLKRRVSRGGGSHWYVQSEADNLMAWEDPLAVLLHFEEAVQRLAQRTYSRPKPAEPEFLKFLAELDKDEALERAERVKTERVLLKWLSECEVTSPPLNLQASEVHIPWFTAKDGAGVRRLLFKVNVTTRDVGKERDMQGIQVIAREYRDGRRTFGEPWGRVIQWLSDHSDVTGAPYRTSIPSRTFSISSVQEWFVNWGGYDILKWEDGSSVQFDPIPAKLVIDVEPGGSGWAVQFPSAPDEDPRIVPLDEVEALSACQESDAYSKSSQYEAIAYVREGNLLRPLLVNGMPAEVFDALLKLPVFPREKLQQTPRAAVIASRFQRAGGSDAVLTVPVVPVVEMHVNKNWLRLKLTAEASDGRSFTRLRNGSWSIPEKLKLNRELQEYEPESSDQENNGKGPKLSARALKAAFAVLPRVEDVEATETWVRSIIPANTTNVDADGVMEWYANDSALKRLMEYWVHRPENARFYVNKGLLDMFAPVRVNAPRITVEPSGVDFLSVSIDMEEELQNLSYKQVGQILGSTQTRLVLVSGKLYRRSDLEEAQRCVELMDDLGIEADGGTQRVHAIQLAGSRALSANGQSPAMSAAVEGMIKRVREAISSFQGIEKANVPAPANGILRPYQQHGVDFLVWSARTFGGALLADDMGLGKTIQLLSAIASLRQDEKKTAPCLVVCPASVVHNWRREAEKFTPHLKVLVVERGSKRKELLQQIDDYDLVILNYALVRKDIAVLRAQDWDAIIVDEAQAIKNPTADISRALKLLTARWRFALTGTPIENRIMDLWSIMDFALPGFLGKSQAFEEQVKKEPERAARYLRARLRPVLLRRLKSEVAPELPERIEERKDCEMTAKQKQAYLAELKRTREMLEVAEGEVIGKQRIQILAALMRLREICCDPALLGIEAESGKVEELMDLLSPLLEAGHKVLVFSQFVRMLELLQERLTASRMKTYMLTGKTTKRHELITRFEEDTEPSIFLLSLKAGGTGLNLTSASHVVLFDPWWNPAVEAQAIDRTHRIGQDKTVLAFRLVTMGTIEERIIELQEKKKTLVRNILEEDSFNRSLTRKDLEFLLQPT